MKPPKTKIRCNRQHGGNRRLTPTLRDCYECNGCGANYTRAQVDKRKAQEATRKPLSQNPFPQH